MYKIVVVEDQQVLATVYRNKFVAEGYEVEVATDGEAGVELITSTKPDLVILDVKLPKLSGLEVLKQVRANPQFQTLPVIIFSNNSLPGMVEDAWKAGATMVLSKSSHSPKQIVESVRTALKEAYESQQFPSTTPPGDGLVAARNTPTQPNAGLTPTQSCSPPAHILMVEDHPDVRALISLLLDRAGYQVTIVESHAGALRSAKLQQFDLFLINRVSPDGLGLTLCRELRISFPRQPIVLYSTVALPAEQQAGLEAGANAFLATPVELLSIGSFLPQLIAKESRVVGN
jgi:CheY-like chemotaxis protein